MAFCILVLCVHVSWGGGGGGGVIEHLISILRLSTWSENKFSALVSVREFSYHHSMCFSLTQNKSLQFLSIVLVYSNYLTLCILETPEHILLQTDGMLHNTTLHHILSVSTLFATTEMIFYLEKEIQF